MRGESEKQGLGSERLYRKRSWNQRSSLEWRSSVREAVGKRERIIACVRVRTWRTRHCPTVYECAGCVRVDVSCACVRACRTSASARTSETEPRMIFISYEDEHGSLPETGAT